MVTHHTFATIGQIIFSLLSQKNESLVLVLVSAPSRLLQSYPEQRGSVIRGTAAEDFVKARPKYRPH